MSANTKPSLSGQVSSRGNVQGTVAPGNPVVSDERIAEAVDAYMANNPIPYPSATIENNILKVT